MKLHWPFRKNNRQYSTVTLSKTITTMQDSVEFMAHINAPDSHEDLQISALAAIERMEEQSYESQN
jgi:hypothetical protein